MDIKCVTEAVERMERVFNLNKNQGREHAEELATVAVYSTRLIEIVFQHKYASRSAKESICQHL